LDYRSSGFPDLEAQFGGTDGIASAFPLSAVGDFGIGTQETVWHSRPLLALFRITRACDGSPKIRINSAGRVHGRADLTGSARDVRLRVKITWARPIEQALEQSLE